jgi:hypothetical protein
MCEIDICTMNICMRFIPFTVHFLIYLQVVCGFRYLRNWLYHILHSNEAPSVRGNYVVPDDAEDCRRVVFANRKKGCFKRDETAHILHDG